MIIENIGTSNFILKDKRGNTIILEPSLSVEVDDKVGAKLLGRYSFLKEIKIEKPKVVIEKIEKVENVSRETPKKKTKRKKDELSNNN